MRHRYGENRPRTARATSGDVFAAISRDGWARDHLEEVYRKLFEGQGVRQGSSPDHFIYVTPGRARSEINALSEWVGERFGEPGSTVPKKTPFGYLSGRWDGWITFFAALMHGGDDGLARDFTESVAQLSWAGFVTSRTATVGSGSTSAPPSPPPSAPLLGAPRERGRYGAPTSGRVFVTPPPEKPGIFQKIADVFSPPRPPAQAPSPPPPYIPVAPTVDVGGGYAERTQGCEKRPLTTADIARAQERQVASMVLPVGGEEPWTEEDEQRARADFERLRGRASFKMDEEALADLRRQREADVENLRKEVKELKQEEARREKKAKKAAEPVSPRAAMMQPDIGEEDEERSARLAQLERDRIERGRLEREERARLSTVAQLARPKGSPGSGLL